jgi:hypothetical protein
LCFYLENADTKKLHPLNCIVPLTQRQI